MTGDALVTSVDQIGQRPYATELRDLLDPKGSYQCAAVFLVENTPTICFKDGGTSTNKEAIDAVRQRLWNQNLISALLVCDDLTLNAFAIPKIDESPAAETVKKTEIRSGGPWSAAEIQSSEVQQRLSDWFDPIRRVDRQLIRQLGSAVTSLTRGKKPLIASDAQAKMLLAQIMFISYLEHRGIAGDEYRELHRLGKLHELVRSKNGAGVDALIKQLKHDFNGDFLEPSEIRWADLSPGVLGTVDDFLSRVDLRTGQRDFWNYDFSQIPVELLSGIYEIFLESDRKIDGAYYTPRVLAELAIQQAFDGLESLKGIKVYDGACGSGILLTTAFRRLVSYEEATLGRNLAIQERIELLQATVFGGDINPIACRVTAFSLYLCLLENLAPADLAKLQEDSNCKLPQLIGENIAQGAEKGDFFSTKNAFADSSTFDIVISNPPWRELAKDEAPNALDWAGKAKVQLPHRQIAAAYALKCTRALKTGGRMVLILPTSLITAPSNEPFLQQLTVRVKLDRLINLSDFRRILFAKAEHACTIVCARNEAGLADGRIDGSFEYWSPKADISFALNRLTLHTYDRVVLSRASVVAGNNELRRSFWGSSRDHSLYHRLLNFPSLKEAISTRKWAIAKGYHKVDGNKIADARLLADFDYMPTDALNTASPVADLSKLKPFPVDDGVASIGNIDLYSGPRILFTDGTSVQMEVRAAYADQPFCFSSGVGALGFGRDNAPIAKFVACYLRSSLVKYWLMLTSYTAQTERARVTLSEIKSLPVPSWMLSKSAIPVGIGIFSDLLDQLSVAVNQAQHEVEKNVRARLDEAIFDVFKLSPNERIIVSDMARLNAESLQPTSYSELFTPIQSHPERKDISAYLDTFLESLRLWVTKAEGAGTIDASVLTRGDRTPLDVVHVRLQAPGATADADIQVKSARAILEAISKRLAFGSQVDFFAMPNTIFVWGNDIYIVKPRRMRFWTKAAALRDADELYARLSSGWSFSKGARPN
ncbi:HsdM family class I SAM-dependent methyltransferase [Agrobacterium cavarae]|nr:N-6 DNA methylase [Agrobacterium cavarae]